MDTMSVCQLETDDKLHGQHGLLTCNEREAARLQRRPQLSVGSVLPCRGGGRQRGQEAEQGRRMQSHYVALFVNFCID